MSLHPDPRQLRLIQAGLLIAGLLPLALLLWAFQQHALGDEPIKFVEGRTGLWTFNFLLLTLCISPLRAITQWHWLLRLRRLLGLLTFLYATLHFLSFIGLAHDFSLDAIARGVMRQSFASIGFVAFLLLIPLAATSNPWALRAVGGKQWRELHRNIYLIGILACVHYFWLSKPEDILWPIAYSGALAALLAWRIRERRRQAIPLPAQARAKPLRYFKQRPD